MLVRPEQKCQKTIPVTIREYPALFAIVGANVPDLRGEFVRGWDHNRGIDNNRALLSAQDFSTSADGLSINDPGHGHSGSASSSESVWAATGSSGVVFDSPANRKMQAKSVGFSLSVSANSSYSVLAFALVLALLLVLVLVLVLLLVFVLTL